MSNPTPAIIATPVLLDLAIAQICDALKAGLPWLDNAYGKSERRERATEGTPTKYPAVYCGGSEYLGLFPDSLLGNFTFFDIEDSQEIEQGARAPFYFSARFGLIVWFDFRTVFPPPLDHHAHTIENVKIAVINAITGSFFGNVRVTLESVQERSENVYRGYSLSELDNQFQMRPYGAFRINGELKYYNACT